MHWNSLTGIGNLFMVMNDCRVYRATRYIADDLTVKVTRRHRPRARARQEEFVVTFGKPNYAERAFIRKCKLAGEPFPVRKIQLKFYPQKKTKKAA